MSTAASAAFMSLACCAAETWSPLPRTSARRWLAWFWLGMRAEPKEYHRVLDLLAAKAREGLAVLGQEGAESGRRDCEKGLVLIGERSGLENLSVIESVVGGWSLVVGRTTDDCCFILSILDGLPESDPDVEQAQSGGNAAGETAGDDGAKRGVGREQRVVGPLRPPGQDHEHYAESRRKNTNESTATRWSHRCAGGTAAAGGEGREARSGTGTGPGTTDGAGDGSSPTRVGSEAKGSLGSEIIARRSCSEIVTRNHARVVISKAVSKDRGMGADRVASRRKSRTHFVHSTTLEPECARPRRDSRYWRCTRW